MTRIFNHMVEVFLQSERLEDMAFFLFVGFLGIGALLLCVVVAFKKIMEAMK